MSKIYIYVGFRSNMYFFYHHIRDDQKYNKTKYNVDGQILNCLINETMITDYNKRCLVFTTSDTKLMVTSILHAKNKNTNIEYDKKNLKTIFIQCIKSLNVKKDKGLMFEYIYVKKCFCTYEINFSLLRKTHLLDMLKDETKINVDVITYFTTSKLINYI